MGEGTAKVPNELLRYQRERRGWSQAKLAEEMQKVGDGNVDGKMVGKWERGERKPRPHYRERLCRLFNMTADQLGFTPVRTTRTTAIQILTPEQVAQLSLQDLVEGKKPTDVQKLQREMVRILGIASSTIVIAPIPSVLEGHFAHPEAHVAFLESEIKSRWTIYHTAGAQHAHFGFDYLLQEVVECSQASRGTPLYERAHLLLAMSYQLQSCILRDLMFYTEAYRAHRKAFLVASELHEPELIAAALTREGITLNQQGQPLEAIARFSRALELVKHLGYTHLEGYTLQALSEAQAKVQQHQEAWESIGLTEEAIGHLAERPEQSLVRLNKASVIAQKGVNAVLLHDFKDAISFIDHSLKTYDPTLVRGRARLLAQKAEAYSGLGMIEESVTSAEEAVMLARSVGSTKTINRVKTLYTYLNTSSMKGERAIALLGNALSRGNE